MRRGRSKVWEGRGVGGQRGKERGRKESERGGGGGGRHGAHYEIN